MTLQSQLFAGDPVLQAVADDLDRISRVQHNPSESVRRIQTALETWRPGVLAQFGADSQYGDETAGAVVRFKIDELGVPAAEVIDDVGPRTVIRLDEIMVAAENPVPPVPVPPTPVPPVRIRRDIWRLQPIGNVWHPIVEAYSRGVRRMQEERPADPLAMRWSYQRDVHSMRTPSDTQFRDQCQHVTSFFLPWHRMYLSVFEKILIEVIGTLPEVSDETKATWALPYWDYDRTDSNALPPAFREPNLPDGSPNALFVPPPGRIAGVTRQVNPITIGARSTSAQFWFAQQTFEVTSGPSFGGPAVGRHHDLRGASAPGLLEISPHGSVHNFVGGMMADPDQAAADPIFWLHHANIDRCWEIWRRANPGRDVTTPEWQRTDWDFRTTTGATKFFADKVFDTRTLDYVYEDVSTPPSATVVFPIGGVQVPTNPGDRPMQLVAALDGPVELVDGEARDMTMAMADIGPLVEAIADTPRVVLALEHVTVGPGAAPSYAAFVRPAGDDGTEVVVGVLSFFGAGGNVGDEQEYNFAFDLTSVVEQLSQVGQWDPANVRVGLRPLDEEWIGEVRSESGLPTISIGSVGIFLQ